MEYPQPPEGYVLRVATLADAPAMADLINEVNVAEMGFPLTTAEEVRSDLTAPGREAGAELLLIGPDDALGGYLTVTPPQEGVVSALAFVSPSMWGRGLSAWLLSLAEQIARPQVPVLRGACWQTNEGAARLFASLGFAYARTFHVMRIDFAVPVEAPPTPAGIAIRTFDPERDREVAHAALREAFADHWGFGFEPFDQWLHSHIESESAEFDPELWFLALDGDAVVGVVNCQERQASDPDTAYVGALGVRRQWRGRGIGRALLLQAFAAVGARGVSSVELGVDSSSETGALALYEGVGMHVKYSFEFWDKPLD